MEKNFSIDRAYLKEILNNLRKYSSDEDALLDSYRLEKVIERCNNNFSSNENVDLMELLSDDLNSYKFYRTFYSLIEKFVISGYSLEELDFCTKYTKATLSNDKTFSIVKSFFEEQGKFFHSGFSEFEEEASDHLEFINPCANTDGEMVYLKSTGDAFLFIPDNKDFTKIMILTHEIEHAIDSFKNELFYENTLIREVSAIFMEMIAGDYVAHKYGFIQDSYQRKLSLHYIIKEQASIVIDKMDMLEIIFNNQNLNQDDLFKLLEEEGYSKECIEFLAENTIMQDFYYLIPQLIAIELYFIYIEKDKQLALNILEDIILNASDYSIFDILKKYEIKLCKNVEKYEKMLLSKVKKQ